MSQVALISDQQPAMQSDEFIADYQCAQKDQNIADTLTDIRKASSIPLAVLHVVFGGNKVVFGAGAVSAGLDAVDGFYSRRGQKVTNRLGVPRIPSRSDDPAADRDLFDALMIGQICREAIIEKDMTSATVKTGAFIVNKCRDYFMARTRKEALALGKNVDAIKINKYKTDLLLGGAVAGLLPESRTRLGRIAPRAAVVGGVALGVYGYFKFKKHLEEQPPKLTVVRDDTIPEPA